MLRELDRVIASKVDPDGYTKQVTPFEWDALLKLVTGSSCEDKSPAGE